MRKSWNIIVKKIFLAGLCGSLVISNVSVSSTVKAEKTVDMTSEKNYIISVNSAKQLKAVGENYDSSDVLNTNAEGCLEENNMAAVTLNDRELSNLRNSGSVEFVEPDLIMKASTEENEEEYHEKQIEEIELQKNDEEWNVKMIHADVARSKIKNKRDKKNHVKIAILDSGVDYNTDMNIIETMSLVPGEEEINPLFMDATGHGTSVAGLVAAKDNEEGITGIDPYADIYSIRVLDDNNCSPVSRVVEGIYMAIDKKVDIINMSFGIDTYSEALEKAVKDAANAGILVIAAAGNTGLKKASSTVQYPAAFEEVMAVGSVDSRGEAADSSAKGGELDIVAPGELVRSTGMFGSELVESGTSLAAPQVTGAAALILEKDKDLSPNFVKCLLQQTANSYGKADEYGAGLLDIDYALDNFESFKKQYKQDKSEIEIEENIEKVPVFNDTGCVEGCWRRDDHEDLVKGDYSNVKNGARFPDEAKFYSKFHLGKKGDGKELYEISGMDYNPWWHGYFRKNKGNKFLCNYVATYIYETEIANCILDGGTPKDVSGINDLLKREIYKHIGAIPWTLKSSEGIVLYSKYPTAGQKRAFIWGMAIHNLADTFAHSTAVKGKRIKHNPGNRDKDADNSKYYKKRWDCAVKAVQSAMNRYTNKKHPSGSYLEYKSVCQQEQFQMINIYAYIKEVVGLTKANPFKKANISMTVNSD